MKQFPYGEIIDFEGMKNRIYGFIVQSNIKIIMTPKSKNLSAALKAIREQFGSGLTRKQTVGATLMPFIYLQGALRLPVLTGQMYSKTASE